ncbi:MAG: NmrA family NAD(P)-binding protein, partial [Deltaproteobacteria bacterium]|nr:NmrA family NAD(P)-binding protein [Deltaproteobacteria bacterium]
MAEGKQKKILVTGATGQQGGAAVPNLLANGHRLRVMTRSPEKAKSIRSPNVEVVQGDFQDKESLKKALDGMYGAFVMGTPYEKGPEAEVTEGKAMIDACAEKGISHVVYS